MTDCDEPAGHAWLGERVGEGVSGGEGDGRGVGLRGGGAGCQRCEGSLQDEEAALTFRV